MFDIKTVGDVLFSILGVLPRTLGLAWLILAMAVILGSILAIIRIKRIPVLGSLVIAYISLLRGIPLVVLLYITYYALPQIAVQAGAAVGLAIDPNAIPPVYTVLLAYTLYMTAFQSENIRGALVSVEQTQIEAAWSIGLTPFQTMRRIVLPQAFLVAVPNICNGYIGIIKALSLAFMVSFVDILAQAKLSAALNFRYIESYLAAALTYWIVCMILTFIFKKFEKRLARSRLPLRG